MSIALVLLMFFSIFGVWASTAQDDKIKFNDFTFKIKEDAEKYGPRPVLVTKIDKKEVILYNQPESVMNIPVNGNMTELLAGENILLTGNPNNMGQLMDALRYEYTSQTSKNIFGAVDGKYENFTQFPIATCLNASSELPILHFQLTNMSTNITIDNNCAEVYMNPRDALYVRDRLMLSLAAIVNE